MRAFGVRVTIRFRVAVLGGVDESAATRALIFEEA